MRVCVKVLQSLEHLREENSKPNIFQIILPPMVPIDGAEGFYQELRLKREQCR
jgi:hypothetical protein